MVITDLVKNKLNNIPLKDYDFSQNKTTLEITKNILKIIENQTGIKETESTDDGFTITLFNDNKFNVTVSKL